MVLLINKCYYNHYYFLCKTRHIIPRQNIYHLSVYHYSQYSTLRLVKVELAMFGHLPGCFLPHKLIDSDSGFIISLVLKNCRSLPMVKLVKSSQDFN